MNRDEFRLGIPAEHTTRLASELEASGHARLNDAFALDEANALHQHLVADLPWSRVFNQGDNVWDLGPESIEALSGSDDTPLLDAVNRGARDGFQFLFDSVRVSDDPVDRRSRNLLLDRLIDALNREDNLTILRDLVGDDRVVRVDGQATRYLPGHFLTRHDDNIDGKGRIAAYVISLNPHWRPEWGGLLLFHSQSGDVVRGLNPCFNAIHVFKVPQLHSVSQVTGFAGAPRLSITGWLRRW